MTWMDGTADLIELLDRQFAYLLGRDRDRVLHALPRVIRLIQSEPRLKAIVDEFSAEMARSLDSFVRHEESVMVELRTLWERHGPELELADSTSDFPYAGPRVRSMVMRNHLSEKVTFPQDDEPSGDPGRCSRPLFGMRHLCKCLLDRCEASAQPPHLQDLSTRLQSMQDQHDHAVRQFWLDGRTLPGVAYLRLASTARSVNAVPVPYDGSDEALVVQVNAFRGAELSDLVFAPHCQPHTNVDKLTPVIEQVRRDAALVHEELRAQIGLTRSHFGLVMRFADRCQQYDAARLRAAVGEDKTGRPERCLTLELARFLFDHGLTPLIDPEIGGLRPDVFEPHRRWALYVEAKQYDKNATRRSIVENCAQVWSTWNRLRSRYEVSEAFLVVFRRGGPVVHLPKLVRHDDLSLYPVLVDIAPTEEAGSREKSLPLDVTAQDLLPTGSATGAQRATPG